MLHHEILPILSPKLFGNCRRFFFGVKARIFAAFTDGAALDAVRQKVRANSLADLSGSLRSLPSVQRPLLVFDFTERRGLHSDLQRIGEGACATTGVLGGSPGVRMTALIDLIHTWSIAHLQAILGNQRNFTRRMYAA